MIKIFVIEDEKMVAKRIKHHLSLNPDFEVFVFHELSDALQFMDESVDCVILDHFLPDGQGLDYVERFLSFTKNLPIIIISGQQDQQVAESFIDNGAFEYIVKDDFLELKLKLALKKAERQIKFNREYRRLSNSREKFGAHTLVGNSFEMERIKLLVSKAQETSIFVSIMGETGTGKEVVARTIHSGLNWSNKPFIGVNMSAIPVELAESTLFGHEVGAFSGAVATKKGVFEEAGNGILFLDEISDTPLEIQAKLLRAIQEKVFRRVGGTKDIPFNARIIVASQSDLITYVNDGLFREDLYYRLMGFPIRLYPLRDHKSDIVALANKFLDEFALEEKKIPKTLSQEALNDLMSHEWPGNIRELKATIHLASVLAESNEIQSTDIRINGAANLEGNKFKAIGEKTLKQYTKEIIESHLEEYDNDLEKVSSLLQIGKSTLYRMIKNKEIERK